VSRSAASKDSAAGQPYSPPPSSPLVAFVEPCLPTLADAPPACSVYSAASHSDRRFRLQDRSGQLAPAFAVSAGQLVLHNRAAARSASW
jgi:hypothetical protein